MLIPGSHALFRLPQDVIHELPNVPRTQEPCLPLLHYLLEVILEIGDARCINLRLLKVHRIPNSASLSSRHSPWTCPPQCFLVRMRRKHRFLRLNDRTRIRSVEDAPQLRIGNRIHHFVYGMRLWRRRCFEDRCCLRIIILSRCPPAIQPPLVRFLWCYGAPLLELPPILTPDLEHLDSGPEVPNQVPEEECPQESPRRRTCPASTRSSTCDQQAPRAIRSPRRPQEHAPQEVPQALWGSC